MIPCEMFLGLHLNSVRIIDLLCGCRGIVDDRGGLVLMLSLPNRFPGHLV